MDVPPEATAMSWNAFACSADAHLKPIVVPLPQVAGSPSIGSLMLKVLPSWR